MSLELLLITKICIDFFFFTVIFLVDEILVLGLYLLMSCFGKEHDLSRFGASKQGFE